MKTLVLPVLRVTRKVLRLGIDGFTKPLGFGTLPKFATPSILHATTVSSNWKTSVELMVSKRKE